MAHEDIIQFLWKHKLSQGKRMYSTCGQELVVLSPGEQNFHAGPDFFNARIQLGSTIWAGNVEVHQKASDWYRHSHHIDPAYNNVILHVVGEFDADISNSLGRRILTLVMEYPEPLVDRYFELKKNEGWLPCGPYLKEFPRPHLKDWLNYLRLQRNQEKSQRYSLLAPSIVGNREESFYWALASGFGFSQNSLPFELLAKALPLNRIAHLRENQFELEALFFGHAGLLFPAKSMGTYPSSLWARYEKLQHLTSNKAIPHHLWKFLRIRPASFPTLRISQFVSILHSKMPLLENILTISSLNDLEQFLRAGATTYWDNHYLFGKCSPPCKKYLGQHAVNTLIINVVLPFLHSLGQTQAIRIGIHTGEIISQLKAESNQIIQYWRSYGIHAKNAGESQALLQLFNVYCKQKRCLDCQIGSGILEESMHEKK